MKFVKLNHPDSQEFREAWEIYESSFPLDERRALGLQKELIKNKLYHFFIALKNKVLVAIITDWDLGNFLFVEHLAVKEEFRGKGIGTKLLKEYTSKNKQKMVLEVERPDNELARKRIRFYERIGFKLNTFDYLQPSLGKDKNPVPLFLMTYPDKINNSEFSSTRKKIHTIVHGLKNPLLSS
ncbi:GNAT family N-acetyltransferase [Candidatus Woesearchaeota archaeon]|nr:GNAT family N-acetyltransferase [Candidatus Woesearchaeota archaeon]